MKLLFKPSMVLGSVLGAILGILMALPFIQCLIFFLYITVGGAVVYYLKRNAFVGILTLRDGAFIGTVAGFFAFLAGYVIYLPVFFLLNFIYFLFAKFILPIFHVVIDMNSVYQLKSGFDNLNTFMFNSPIYFFGVLAIVFFLSLLLAMFNAFSGLIAAFIYEKIETTQIENAHDIEIK